MAGSRETILLGASPMCDECGVTPELDVYSTPAGYYVGTYCNCGPFSRESGYYPTYDAAKKALDSGMFGRSSDFNPSGLEVIHGKCV